MAISHWVPDHEHPLSAAHVVAESSDPHRVASLMKAHNKNPPSSARLRRSGANGSGASAAVERAPIARIERTARALERAS